MDPAQVGGCVVRLAFDIGGTFTDFVLEDGETGRLHFGKILSTPAQPADAVMAGLSQLLDKTAVAPGAVDVLLHATTVATNAIIERKGSPTALITTAGFRDILIIGRQKRYETYDLHLDKPQPLVRRRDIYEVPERILADGTVRTCFDSETVDRLIDHIITKDYRSVAVAFLHSYIEPKHERLVAERFAARHPGISVSLSSDVSPKFREYERTSTVVANAYIKPIISNYICGLSTALAERGVRSDLFIMQSNGGLVSPEIACDYPVRMVESGPAAGVLMCAVVGRQEGFDNVLTFDMGGTTAKLGAITGGDPAIVTTFEVDQVRYRKGSGLPLNIAAIELLEIGAGGGSIADVELGLIKVGPESAGADPGPICYLRGGSRPTVTDANLVLGYLDPEYFNGGAMAIDPDAAARGIEAHIGEPLGLSVSDAAWGIYTMANANMERAMRVVTLERGRDPRRHALVAFGGAGPLHAGRLARALGVPKIIVPYGAGVGSAIGLLEANPKIDVSVTRVLQLDDRALPVLKEIYRELAHRLKKDVERLPNAQLARHLRFAYLRYVGQGHELRVDLPNGAFEGDYVARLIAQFHEAYQQVYGYRDEAAKVEAVDWYLVAEIPAHFDAAKLQYLHEPRGTSLRSSHRPAFFPELGGYAECTVIDRYAMKTGQVVEGPAVIEERESTTVVVPGDRAEVSSSGNLVLSIAEAGT
jgi:N-methylhydantoinase A